MQDVAMGKHNKVMKIIYRLIQDRDREEMKKKFFLYQVVDEFLWGL